MKRLLFIALLFVAFDSFSQPLNYTRIANRYRWVSGMFDSALYVPRYNGTPSGVRVGENSAIDGAIAIDTANGRAYMYTGGAWVRLANYSELSSAQTWQQTLTAGSTLTGNNTITGGGFGFTWDSIGDVEYNLKNNKNYYSSVKGTGYWQANSDNGVSASDFYLSPQEAVWSQSLGTANIYNELGPGLTDSGWLMLTQLGTARYTTMRMQPSFFDIRVTSNLSSYQSAFEMNRDSITLKPNAGRINIDSLRTWTAVGDTTYKKPMTWDTRNGRWEYASNWFGGGSGTTALSGLTAATATNDINNDNYRQIWRWNGLAATQGIYMYSTSTAASGNAQELLRVEVDGTNSNSSQTTKAGSFYNTHAGTSSTNIALLAAASNGSTNISLDLGVAGSAAGNMRMNGATSGSITITPAAAAGTYTLTLPTNDGDASQFLQTNGSGVLSWASSGVPTVGNQGEILQVSNGAAAWKYDTTTLVTFNAGANFAADTAAFTDSTIYGSFKLMGNDTFYVTGVSVVLYSNNAITDTLGIQITYNDTINVIGSHVFVSTYAVNNEKQGQDADGDDFTGSNSVPIPPGNWVWLKSPTVVAGRKPYHMSVSIIGYKKRVN